ncbi:unnamed protein product [Schistocephalus solidus]|uniref:Mitochondrial carrier protein n=1 Tax=Schistocephalus solidus TaxID=70667 RepID=A0A183TKM1_SCHSO|nr:unnamed protein product [Schistocephalus solidus]
MVQQTADLAPSGQPCSELNSNFGRIIASSFGGMITSLVMTPLDVVKIRMQSLMVSVFGTRPSAMALPQTVVYYSVNDWLKEKLGYTQSAYKSTLHYGCFSSNDFVPAVVGALSRTVAVFTISPLELLRTKLQSQKMSLKNVFDALRSTINSSGFRSLWMGMGPTLLRDVPYSAIFWFVYDYNKYKYLPTVIEITPLSETVPRPIPSFSSAFFFGACAGFVSHVL